jgi:hypothetical protein
VSQEEFGSWKKALEGFEAIESTIVNEWTAEAEREGVRKGWANAVLRCLQLRFGHAPEDVAKAIHACKDTERLITFYDAALTEGSLDDFRRVTGL